MEFSAQILASSASLMLFCAYLRGASHPVRALVRNQIRQMIPALQGQALANAVALIKYSRYA